MSLHPRPEAAVRVGPVDAAPLPALDPPVSRVLVVVDDAVPEHLARPVVALCESVAPTTVVALRGGEERKSIEGWTELLRQCAAARLDRRSLLVAVGGGALGDAAGFAAATWHRGIRWLAVPTTLLAMIDAHVGGKTALDLDGVKNPVGAFWWPVEVRVDRRYLDGLPPRTLRAGWAELIKAALIDDAPLFEALAGEPGDAARGRAPTDEEIGRAIAVKQRIVAEDPRESDRRRLLNLGHTLGHAFEALGCEALGSETLGGGALLHGEAVAMGTVFAAELAVDLRRAAPGWPERVRGAFALRGLPVDPPAIPPEELLAVVAADKKNAAGELWFVVPEAPGRVTLAPVATEVLRRRLDAGAR